MSWASKGESTELIRANWGLAADSATLLVPGRVKVKVLMSRIQVFATGQRGVHCEGKEVYL